MLQLCDRFHKLPSEIEREDVELIRLIKIEALGRPPQAEGGDMPYA